MAPPEIGSLPADKLIGPADSNPAGEITGKLKPCSLRRRRRPTKAAAAEGAETPSTRSSSKKRGKPTPADSPTPTPVAPLGRSDAKGQTAGKTKATPSRSSKRKKVMVDEDPKEYLTAKDEDGGGDEEGEEVPESGKFTAPTKRKAAPRTRNAEDYKASFVGDPIPENEARKRWPERYQMKEAVSSKSKNVSVDPDDIDAKRHYRQARVDNLLYNLYDDVSVKIDLDKKKKALPKCDLYFDMSYSLAYTSFANLSPGYKFSCGEALPSLYSEEATSQNNPTESSTPSKTEFTLLDLYSGCGAMSTGLCLGAKISGINLVTKWAVDINEYACESLRMNHPETEVRQDNAEHFLKLLKVWEKMCRKYKLFGSEWIAGQGEYKLFGSEWIAGQGEGSSESDDDGVELADKGDWDDDEEFEVGKIVGICFGDPQKNDKVGLYYQVRWKEYGPSQDTWEPAEVLSKCKERIESFVRSGFRKRILPLPGMVDVICGGPPCQGISGFNRYRKPDPLDDPKNKQMPVFMDIVEFLKPKHVLMENVVDLLKFAEGYLGRYALGRLVEMNYQARLGIMAAGCYGLPQFRMRCFIWGAQPTEKLPKFPLPSHDVVVRGGIPRKFEASLVAYNENEKPTLQRLLVLEDAISDLPPVCNNEIREEMAYGRSAITDFQRFIRLTKNELLGSASTSGKSRSRGKLYDHRPLNLNEDDYQRVCQIPKRKGACFRDLAGLIVGANNVVKFDPNIGRVYLPSGSPLVPDYAMTFVDGKSPKPFARLWWDVTVPTVVTRAEPHNQIILHPMQDRVLTIRENARLQGFPDFYRFYGPVKQRYIQVGNAVAFPVSRALGYSLGMACRRQGSDAPVFRLPPSFP